MRTLQEVAVAFGRALRDQGLEAPVGSVVCFAQALAVIGLDRPERVFWAGRASFVHRPEDDATYAATFSGFFSGDLPPSEHPGHAVPLTLSTDEDAPEGPDPGQGRESREARAVRWSSIELLRDKDFASCSQDEMDAVRRLMGTMRRSSPRRPTRRRVPPRRSRGAPDLRATVRRALRSGGEPLRLSRLGHAERERPVVLLVDVSGSMEPYARAFLQFAHAAIAGGRRVEAFTLGTRLTRITRELSWRDPDAAVLRAAATVSDISGGTRLGEGLQSFNDNFGVVGMARGAIVVMLSDGWDRGAPEKISCEMSRLKRVAHRVIWVNPLKASPGYEPLARGMAAALPYTDVFMEGHSLGSLEKLVDAMADRPARAVSVGAVRSSRREAT